MNWKFWTWFSSNDDPVIDHLPISGNKDYRRLRKKARRRHGKPFRANVIYDRVRNETERAAKVRKLGVK